MIADKCCSTVQRLANQREVWRPTGMACVYLGRCILLIIFFLPSSLHLVSGVPTSLSISMESSSSCLLDLPYELRQRILTLALKQKGTIELQHPVWAGKDVFAQPLFQVCRLLRDEALQAFYETNCFLWIIDSSVTHRSDPAVYASITGDARQPEDGSVPSSKTSPLTPTLPWQYPHLKKHLRHLNLNIYLPSNLVADLAAAQAWFTEFPQQLERMIKALDCGCRLAELHTLLTAKRFNTRIALAGEQLKALNVLTQMKVRGSVKVQTRYDFKEVKASIASLELERRMKA